MIGFQTRKEDLYRRPKHRIFANGLVYAFRQKFELFIRCFFLIKQRKIVFGYSKQKRMVFTIKKETFKKDQKIKIFQRGQSTLFVKNSNFFSGGFFLNQATTDRPDQKKKRPEKTTFIKIKNIELYESMLFVKKSQSFP